MFDFKLWLTRLCGRGSKTRCPGCGRIYDTLHPIENWGIEVDNEGAVVDICGNCLSNPEQIDLVTFKLEHRRRGTPEEEIQAAVDQIHNLKKGNL